MMWLLLMSTFDAEKHTLKKDVKHSEDSTHIFPDLYHLQDSKQNQKKRIL